MNLTFTAYNTQNWNGSYMPLRKYKISGRNRRRKIFTDRQRLVKQDTKNIAVIEKNRIQK